MWIWFHWWNWNFVLGFDLAENISGKWQCLGEIEMSQRNCQLKITSSKTRRVWTAKIIVDKMWLFFQQDTWFPNTGATETGCLLNYYILNYSWLIISIYIELLIPVTCGSNITLQGHVHCVLAIDRRVRVTLVCLGSCSKESSRVAYKTQNVLPVVLEAGVWGQGPGTVVLWWGPSSWLQEADSSLYPHRRGRGALWGPSQGHRSHHEAPPSWPNHLPNTGHHDIGE